MRLFIKIFLCFWLVVLLVGMTLEMSTLMARYYEDRWVTVLHTLMPMEAEKSARMFEQSGKQALQDYLDDLQRQKAVRFYFFDEVGNSLLDRNAPKVIREMATNREMLDRTARENLSYVSVRQGIAIRLVEGPSGRKYSLAFQSSPSQVLKVSSTVGEHPYLRLVAIGLFGGALCLLLTLHITRPLVRLRAAASSIAEGRLRTRVDPTVLRRRDEIAMLGRDFDRMAEQIESLVTAQRDLLGDVSHELRSPLSRLIVALSLLRQCPKDEALEYLNRIGLEADRLDKLIGQLLTLTRVDSGVDANLREKFDLTNLVQEVAADGDFEARAHKRSVKLLYADACTMSGLPELLRSAIENVVRNAVRHTPDGTSVDITLERRNTPWDQNKVDKAKAILRIRDHGPGVPENMLSEIFLPFRRASQPASARTNGPFAFQSGTPPPSSVGVHSESDQSESQRNGASDSQLDGAGLGLAIADRIVRMHYGAIAALNASDGGLIVEIELPLT
jgi:two-component system sensor histidine kinase CpxA